MNTLWSKLQQMVEVQAMWDRLLEWMPNGGFAAKDVLSNMSSPPDTARKR